MVGNSAARVGLLQVQLTRPTNVRVNASARCYSLPAMECVRYGESSISRLEASSSRCGPTAQITVVVALVLTLSSCSSASGGAAVDTASRSAIGGGVSVAPSSITQADFDKQRKAAYQFLKERGYSAYLPTQGLYPTDGAGLLVSLVVGMANVGETSNDGVIPSTQQAIEEYQRSLTSMPCSAGIAGAMEAAKPIGPTLMSFEIPSDAGGRLVGIEEWNAENPAAAVAPVLAFVDDCALDLASDITENAVTVRVEGLTIAGNPAVGISNVEQGVDRTYNSVLAWKGQRMIALQSGGSSSDPTLSVAELADAADQLLRTTGGQ